MDQPSEPLIEYLDGILKELETGDGEYGCPFQKTAIISRSWLDLALCGKK